METGCVIDITLTQERFPVRIHIINVTATNNTHGLSGIFIGCTSFLLPNQIILERVYYNSNHVVGNIDTGADFHYSCAALGKVGGDESPTRIEIIDSNFVNNDFRNGKTIDMFSVGGRVFGVLLFSLQVPHMITIRNTTISNHTGKYGAAIYFEPILDAKDLVLEIIDSTFANNTIFSSDYYKRGAVTLQGIGNVIVYGCRFVNNSGTGLLIENSGVYFSGSNLFQGNSL